MVLLLIATQWKLHGTPSWISGSQRSLVYENYLIRLLIVCTLSCSLHDLRTKLKLMIMYRGRVRLATGLG